MTAAVELEAAAKRMADAKARLVDEAKRLLDALLDAKLCGADVRDLDIQTIRVRFLTQIPLSLDRKVEALLPKVDAP